MDDASSSPPPAAAKPATASSLEAERHSEARPALPAWAREIVSLYESGSATQFILYGNIYDLFPISSAKGALGSLTEFIQRELLRAFDIVLSFDLGNGIRVEKGQEAFSTWPRLRGDSTLPRAPLQAIDTLTHYFRYCANLARLDIAPEHTKKVLQVACFVKDAHVLAPAGTGLGHDVNAMVLLLRDWATEDLLTSHPMATFLLCENLNDLASLLVNNPRAAKIKIPLPTSNELQSGLEGIGSRFPKALEHYRSRLEVPANQLTGAQLGTIEALLKRKEYEKQPLVDADLVTLKKKLVENDCNGLIEFIESSRTLDDLHGQEKVKEWLRQDIALWKANDLQALPMGYLLCGPVGTGKTYMVECLAGEASVPVVKIKNFRDRWVGSSEGNLEKIFRLLHALGRCIVFIDEADQTLGKRDAGSGDSGLSGRIYSMVAQEMSDQRNRGAIMWVLASSRPDLIEVDLKRPGRVDVKVPLFPTATPEESFALLRALCRRRGLELADDALATAREKMPLLLTPGAADALVGKIYRTVRTRKLAIGEALAASLVDYQPPVDPAIMSFQIELAVKEASDLAFVPEAFRKPRTK